MNNKRLSFVFSLLFTTCLQASQIEVKTDFESASIGQVNRISSNDIELYLKNDNDDPLLDDKPSWRNWWYARFENVPINEPLTLHIKNRGHPYLYMPVYSYDQIHWQRMDEQDVTQSAACDQGEQVIADCELIIHRPFSNHEVWLARFYPYTYSDLQLFLDSLDNDFLKREVIGYSPLHQPIELLTISDKHTDINSRHKNSENKKRIWIHARTHAGETGSSFALEGLIRYLLSDDQTANLVRTHFIFNIIPMVNPDGVVIGNYRTNIDSIDLEQGWIFGIDQPQYLLPEAPDETSIINIIMNQWLNPHTRLPVRMALSLHSSNGDVDTAAFLIPHFGDTLEYSENEQSSWYDQIKFIRLMARNYGGRIEQPPLDGGDIFLNYFYPETWWWFNQQNKVVAMTLETTYGKAGFDHWVTADDLRDLGQAMVKAINCFFDENCPTPRSIQFNGPYNSKIYQEKFRHEH